MDQKPWSFFNMLIATSLFVVHSSASSKEEAYLYEKIGNDYSNFRTDLNAFKLMSDVIVANRLMDDIQDVVEKVYTRDLFGKD